MKSLNTITLAGFAVCGFLLAMKALDLVEAGITLLLMVWGGYAYGAAAARAPMVLWAVLCTAAGLALSLYELHRDGELLDDRPGQPGGEVHVLVGLGVPLGHHAVVLEEQLGWQAHGSTVCRARPYARESRSDRSDRDSRHRARGGS